jgi:hypothetical protein
MKTAATEKPMLAVATFALMGGLLLAASLSMGSA